MDLRDFVRIIHSLVKLYQVLEKESWLKIEDLTNSSSLSNYTSCPAQTKLQNSITQNSSVQQVSSILVTKYVDDKLKMLETVYVGDRLTSL